MVCPPGISLALLGAIYLKGNVCHVTMHAYKILVKNMRILYESHSALHFVPPPIIKMIRASFFYLCFRHPIIRNGTENMNPTAATSP